MTTPANPAAGDGRDEVHVTLGHDLASALAALGAALDLPGHYGHNLDALNDCLSELGRPVELVVDDGEHFARQHAAQWQQLEQVLALRAAQGGQGGTAAVGDRAVAGQRPGGPGQDQVPYFGYRLA